MANDSSSSNGCHCETDCDKHAADAVSAYTQVNFEDAPRLLNQNVQTYGCVFHDINDQSLCQTNIEDPGFLLNAICTNTHLQDYCGKENSEKFCWNLDGEKCRIGNVYFFTENKDYSSRKMWMTSKWLERNRRWL